MLANYCGPRAVAAITGADAQIVADHIVAVRRENNYRGRLQSGGTWSKECLAALRRLGYDAELEAFPRCTVGDLLRLSAEEDATWWLVAKPGHWFAVQGGQVRAGGPVSPRSRVVRAYRITSRTAAGPGR